MTITAIKKERTMLRRTRVTKTERVNCYRCGGRGGSEAWRYTGWTCYRCGGNCTELRDERVYTDPADEARDIELTEAIVGHNAALVAEKWEAGREAREAAEKERDHGYAIEENERFDLRASRAYVGSLGESITVEGTVKVAVSIETLYGNSMLIVVETDDGNLVKTFGSGMTLWELDRDDRVSVTGTVKDFDTYEGDKQTVLTRVKATIEEEA